MDEDKITRHSATTRRRRHIAALLLVVLGSALLPVSVLTVWVRNQVFDTDRYLETVETLASDPTVKSAVANRISEAVSKEADFKTLAQEALPAEASFLAGPIAAGADSLIDTAAKKLVDSEQFQKLWVEANRAGHEGLVAAIKGEKGDVVSTENGQVVLRLGGLANMVLEQIDAQFGMNLADKIPAEKLNVNFVLVDSEQLADVQAGARMLDRLSWLSVILSLGFLAGSVAADPDRRRGLRNVGIGIAASMLLLLLGFGFGRELYLTNLPEGGRAPRCGSSPLRHAHALRAASHEGALRGGCSAPRRHVAGWALRLGPTDPGLLGSIARSWLRCGRLHGGHGPGAEVDRSTRQHLESR